MRIIFLVSALLLAGCASDHPVTEYCSTYTWAETRPLAPTTLDPSLERILRSQLPPQMRAHYVCWYTEADDKVIASTSKNPRTFALAYTFNRVDGKWRLSDAPPIILDVP
jgi:uncharacterized lipoprotein YmbA